MKKKKEIDVVNEDCSTNEESNDVYIDKQTFKMKFSLNKVKEYWKDIVTNINLKFYRFFYNKVNSNNHLETNTSDSIKTDEAIKVSHLFMKYNRKQKEYVIKDCNFIVNKGDFHVFIGQNGCW